MNIPGFLISLLLTLSVSAAYGDYAVVPNDVYNSYTHFLNKRSALNITDYSGSHTNRDVVETIIWQQALKKGGYDKTINIEALDISYSRVILEIKHGTIAAFANSVWLDDIEDYENYKDLFYITEPVIPEHKFYAGFYTTPDRVSQIKIKDKEGISNYKFSCNRHWKKDNQLLEHLNADCMFSNTWEAMVNKLKNKHADMVLAPFQASKDMSLIAFGEILVPLPNVKTSLPGKRVFIISKKSRNGEALFKALNKGIKLMNKEGLIEKAYEQSGFYNHKTKEWKLID
ncbi:hypothetical protein [uncultured Cocleimonas sp.]|uniref:hypothetical protein n=1 Tax=uncultured Cocleimonas sp. TaxID=1051587 RepID=UPI00263587D3|nr:hypothetical protein [uncultured Cocleimonas sp.]